MKKFNSQAGFALLYAVLLTGIILTIGLGLSSIMAEQIILSSTGASSQKAYYAANAAKECIINWGIYGYFDADSGATLSPFGSFGVDPVDEEGLVYNPGSVESVTCGLSGAIDITDYDLNSIEEEVVFNPEPFTVVVDNTSLCASVSFVVRANSTSEIVATGYNVDCDQTDNPRRVERQIVGRGGFVTSF